MISIQELREDGSLTLVKWISIGVVVGAVLAAMVGGAKVILFDTSDSGATVTYKTCLDFDDQAAQAFEDSQSGDPRDRVSAPDFCRLYGAKTATTGDRAKEVMKSYGIYGGIFGFIGGLLVGNSISDKQKEAARRQYQEEYEKLHKSKKH